MHPPGMALKQDCIILRHIAHMTARLTLAHPAHSTPVQVEKADKREESVAVAVVQLVPPGASAGSADLAASRFLLVQRPPSGLLAGLWQFPLVPLSSSAGGGQSGGGEGGGPRPQQQQQAAVDAYLEAQLGARLVPAADAAPGRLAVLERRALGELVHVFSHIRMTMKARAVGCALCDACCTGHCMAGLILLCSQAGCPAAWCWLP